MGQPNGASHNIRHTTTLKLDLGGNFTVEIFNVYLNVKPGELPLAIRAYLYDNGNRMDMVSLYLGTGTEANIDTVRQVACEYLKNQRGLNRVLDALIPLTDQDN